MGRSAYLAYVLLLTLVEGYSASTLYRHILTGVVTMNNLDSFGWDDEIERVSIRLTMELFKTLAVVAFGLIIMRIVA